LKKVLSAKEKVNTHVASAVIGVVRVDLTILLKERGFRQNKAEIALKKLRNG
jgi:hypothetical protein